MLFAIVTISGLFITLGIGAIVADCIIPHIKPFSNFINNLPMFW